jgi:hypothetical protein
MAALSLEDIKKGRPECFTFLGVVGNTTLTQPVSSLRVLSGYNFYVTRISAFSRAEQPFGVGAPGANSIPLLGTGAPGVNQNDFDPRNHYLIGFQVRNSNADSDWFKNRRNLQQLISQPGGSEELAVPELVDQLAEVTVSFARETGVWTNNGAGVFTQDIPIGVALSGFLVRAQAS